MALERSVRPIARRLQCAKHDRWQVPRRGFGSSATWRLEVDTAPTTTQQPPLPRASIDTSAVVEDVEIEEPLRRKAARAAAGSIPFTELPFQCFQEARRYIQEDRDEKVAQITREQERIRRLQDTVVDTKDEFKKQNRLRSMQYHVEKLKVLADSNDPVVKRKFEDGLVDMNKPIYRHLADQKWRSYDRKLLMQRIETMKVIPDVFPTINPTVSSSLYFAGRRIRHGEVVDSLVSESAPSLKIQCYDKGERLVTIAVVDADVPDVEHDSFTYRCHFLASNVPISPTTTDISLTDLNDNTQVILPWLPPYSQKGLEYQILCVFILQQSPLHRPLYTPTHSVDIAALKEKKAQITQRDRWNLRRYVDVANLHPVGVDLFRSKWDDNTAEVMQRAGVPGWDVEFKRKRIEPLPYKRMNTNRYR